MIVEIKLADQKAGLMSRRLLSIAALILAVTGSGLSAQEAENQVPTYEDLPEGALYFKEDHKDWRIRCQKNSAAEDSCQMFQLIVDGQGSPVAQIVFFDIPAGEGFAVAGATITVPLLTALSEDFLLQIDDHPPKAYMPIVTRSAATSVWESLRSS